MTFKMAIPAALCFHAAVLFASADTHVDDSVSLLTLSSAPSVEADIDGQLENTLSELLVEQKSWNEGFSGVTQELIQSIQDEGLSEKAVPYFGNKALVQCLGDSSKTITQVASSVLTAFSGVNDLMTAGNCKTSPKDCSRLVMVMIEELMNSATVLTNSYGSCNELAVAGKTAGWIHESGNVSLTEKARYGHCTGSMWEILTTVPALWGDAHFLWKSCEKIGKVQKSTNFLTEPCIEAAIGTSFKGNNAIAETMKNSHTVLRTRCKGKDLLGRNHKMLCQVHGTAALESGLIFVSKVLMAMDKCAPGVFSDRPTICTAAATKLASSILKLNKGTMYQSRQHCA